MFQMLSLYTVFGCDIFNTYADRYILTIEQKGLVPESKRYQTLWSE